MYDWTPLRQWLASFQAMLMSDVLTVANLVQLLLVALILAAAWGLSPRFCRWLETWRKHWSGDNPVQHAVETVLDTPLVLLWLLPLWPLALLARSAELPSGVIEIAASLLSAWLVIQLAAALVVNPLWARAAAAVAWTLAALNITGLLYPTMLVLDSVGTQLGGLRVSLLTVVKGALWLAVLMWLALAAARIIDNRLKTVAALTPSVQVLLAKLTHVVLLVAAVLVTLNAVGINLTAFTVFSGAIGLGLGIGLQKVVSNLVSGAILLLDKSVKPGDVIAVGGTFGWINQLGARYVSVITRDGIEHLIPNEDLITHRVENWSFTSKLVRLRIPFCICYSDDPRLAMQLAVDAACAVKRVRVHPEPRCLLTGFEDPGIHLELRIWIDDPSMGVANVKSEVMLALWDSFREHGVTFPTPQHEVRIRGFEPASRRDDLGKIAKGGY